ncbi:MULTISPECIES: hypothetical protein [Prosthecochloris]|nr:MULTISPECIES: hypothetical protein [Prosthecochloris]UZJ41917.1 hypothetical protein OO006_02660 [Prosthecochloris sp. SCSIO W1101]
MDPQVALKDVKVRGQKGAVMVDLRVKPEDDKKRGVMPHVMRHP